MGRWRDVFCGCGGSDGWHPAAPERVTRVIVIGASSGLGAEIARIFAARPHCRVGIAARRVGALEEVRASSGGRIAAIKGIDVSSDEAPRLLGELIEELGGMDLLVYCAGVLHTATAGELGDGSRRETRDVSPTESTQMTEGTNGSGVACADSACFPEAAEKLECFASTDALCPESGFVAKSDVQFTQGEVGICEINAVGFVRMITTAYAYFLRRGAEPEMVGGRHLNEPLLLDRQAGFSWYGTDAVLSDAAKSCVAEDNEAAGACAGAEGKGGPAGVGCAADPRPQAAKLCPQSPGRIAVITSVSASNGVGWAPAYSACKSLQSHFLNALEQLERIRMRSGADRRRTVFFTEIQPGFVDTPMISEAERSHLPFLMHEDKVAQLAVRAIDRGRRRAVVDWRWSVIAALWRLAPDWLNDRLPILAGFLREAGGFGAAPRAGRTKA